MNSGAGFRSHGGSNNHVGDLGMAMHVSAFEDWREIAQTLVAVVPGEGCE